MTLEERKILFSSLGDQLTDENNKDMLLNWAAQARNQNGWFTEDNVLLAIKSIAEEYLKDEPLLRLSNEIKPSIKPKKIGVVAAGNIPMVSFHDLLCVVMTGNIALFKASSTDSALMLNIIKLLHEINPKVKEYIQLSDRLNDADAYIATGSDNTARYFHYYFGKKPHIIRKNRSSVAILTGNETNADLRELGNDIFSYFGLGCRNVSKLFVPENYVFDTFFEQIEYWNTILIHHKYSNNYDYNKSILLINLVPHLDNGFLMLKEDENLVSPLSVVHYEKYKNEDDLELKLKENAHKLQCIVGYGHFDFGQSQKPSIMEYADGVNTIDFLNSLN